MLIASTKSDTAVAVYPDSDKVGVWTGNDADPPFLFGPSRLSTTGTARLLNAVGPASRRGRRAERCLHAALPLRVVSRRRFTVRASGLAGR